MNDIFIQIHLYFLKKILQIRMSKKKIKFLRTKFHILIRISLL